MHFKIKLIIFLKEIFLLEKKHHHALYLSTQTKFINKDSIIFECIKLQLIHHQVK